MASKKDLVQAQAFSRRRLLTAFVSGAPGGRELEPTKPLRAVVGGLALTGLLVAGSLVMGLVRPGLQDGWDHNSLVVTTDGGSRYVALEGVLYPVLNTASARLLIASDFHVVQVAEDKIAQTPRGVTVGIPGAPDELPAPDRLVATGWLACSDAEGATSTVLSSGEVPTALAARADAVASGDEEATGVLVENAGDLYLLADGRRYLVPRESSTAVLRAVGQETVVPWPVDGRWLNLFPPGADLDPVVVPETGSALPPGIAAPPGTMVGSVLATADGGRYVVDARGDLIRMSDFAEPLYRLGSGADVPPDIEVTAAQIGDLRTAVSVLGGADWPTVAPTPVPDGLAACALLRTDEGMRVDLVTSDDVVPEAGVDQVAVDPAAGALVRASGGAGVSGPVQLIDRSGTAFALPDASEDVLARLGYASEDITPVPQPWLSLFAPGPALSVDAAAQAFSAAGS